MDEEDAVERIHGWGPVNELRYELLGEVTDLWVKGSLVAGLGFSEAPVRLDVLAREFDANLGGGWPGNHYRYSIAFTLWEAENVPGACGWILEKIASEKDGKTRAMLLYASATHCAPAVAASQARRLFEEDPSTCADVLAWTGSADDLPFLEEAVARMLAERRVVGENRPAFMRAPAKLRRRVERGHVAAERAFERGRVRTLRAEARAAKEKERLKAERAARKKEGR